MTTSDRLAALLLADDPPPEYVDEPVTADGLTLGAARGLLALADQRDGLDPEEALADRYAANLHTDEILAAIGLVDPEPTP